MHAVSYFRGHRKKEILHLLHSQQKQTVFFCTVAGFTSMNVIYFLIHITVINKITHNSSKVEQKLWLSEVGMHFHYVKKGLSQDSPSQTLLNPAASLKLKI